MRKILLICALFLSLGHSVARAGSDDFGIWTEVGATKNLPYGLSLSLSGEFRSANLSRNVDRWSGAFSVGYKPCKYVKFGVGYVFLYNYHASETKDHYKDDIVIPEYKNGYNITEHYWTPRNRFFAEATGSIKLFKRLKISLRERYQYTHRSEQNIPRAKYRFKNGILRPGYPIHDLNNKAESDRQYLRSRLKLEFDRKRCDWQPFVSFELHNALDENMKLHKTRFSTGTTYAISSKHELSAAYIFNNTTDVDDDSYEGTHAVCIGYTFKF